MNYRFLFNLSLIFVLPFLLVQGNVSFAETPAQSGLTLNSALAEAYQKNPDFEAIRAELRAVKELRAQAVAGFKPSVTGTADYTSTYVGLDEGTQNSDPKTMLLEVKQSLYSGGSTLANMQQSDNKIKAERAKLHLTEQRVLLDGVRAYMNFIRAREVVQLNLSNEKVLTNHLNASVERFKLGDITRTDVSQAESRLAKAKASRISAEGDLKKSRAFFEQVIGLSPLDLQKPALEVSLPATENDALTLAENNNPAIAVAKYSEDAARNTTRSIEGTNLPQVELTGSMGKIYDPFIVDTKDENTRSVGIRATLPLYTGGSTASRIRQSRQIESQLRRQLDSTRRAVRQSVIEAWETLTAAEAEAKALQAQIDAAKLALDGVKMESDFGSRTTLNLLDAEQEYLDAQVSLVATETNRIIATYGVLSAIGKLTAEDLHLNVKMDDRL
jgi:outer membrane protein/adhesin transport system outer membrane protein